MLPWGKNILMTKKYRNAILLPNYFAVPRVQHQLGSNPCSQEFFLSLSYLPLSPHRSAPHGLSSVLLLSAQKELLRRAGMLDVQIRAGGSFEIPQGKGAGLEQDAPAEPLPLKIGREIQRL